MGKARPYIKDIEKSGRKDLSNGAPRNNYVGFTFIVLQGEKWREWQSTGLR